MRDFLKENWFVGIVAVFFITVAIIFIYDQNKGKLPGKSVSGKDVIFNVDSDYYTADDLYNELSKSYFDGEIYMTFHKTLLDESVKLTEEEEQELEEQYTNVVSYYLNYYGYDESYLNQIAQYYYGYNTFHDYMFYSEKAERLYSSYITEHIDDFYTEEIAEKLQGRIVRYVVIAMEDPKNPTEEEANKLQEAREAWATDQYNADNFADFAKAYTQDSGSSSGGLFGYLSTNTSSIDETFKATALSLQPGEVSDWVFSKDFGWFLIKVDSTDVKDFKSETDFTSDILDNNEGLSREIMWKKAQELKITFNDEEVEKLVKQYLQVEE